jgi:hypothetical protein
MRTLLARIQDLVAAGKFRVSAHGFEELLNDDISLAWLVASFPDAMQVEEYPDYHKGPCVLALHKDDDVQAVHALWGIANNAPEMGDADYGLSSRSKPMERGFPEEEAEMNRKAVRFVHADRYAAEVEVELIPDDDAWGPYLSQDDALKLDRVRSALKRGDIAAASREARVFELMPLSA